MYIAEWEGVKLRQSLVSWPQHTFVMNVFIFIEAGPPLQYTSPYSDKQYTCIFESLYLSK